MYISPPRKRVLFWSFAYTHLCIHCLTHIHPQIPSLFVPRIRTPTDTQTYTHTLMHTTHTLPLSVFFCIHAHICAYSLTHTHMHAQIISLFHTHCFSLFICRHACVYSFLSHLHASILFLFAPSKHTRTPAHTHIRTRTLSMHLHRDTHMCTHSLSLSLMHTYFPSYIPNNTHTHTQSSHIRIRMRT